MAYFESQRELLLLEKEEDLRFYKHIIESVPVTRRRAEGLTWYPIAIRGEEAGYGDYLIVEAERTTHHDISHQLRFGASAAIFSNHDPANHRLEGIIIHQEENRLKLSLKADELPEWVRDGKLGIDLLFDDNSYEEMFRALKAAAERLAAHDKDNLIKVLTGISQPTFDMGADISAVSTLPLNTSQQEAVARILQADNLAVVHGPPGTGKTTTIVQAVRLLVRQNYGQVLVVAPSNAAVDLLSEKLADLGLNVLRIGNPARVSEKLISLSLDNKVSQHAQAKRIRSLKKQANEFRNMAHKYKRNFGKAEREQRKALFEESRRIMKEVGNTERYIIDDLVSNAEVITATLVGASHYTIRNLSYSTVVIDEAGQALEPACWIPLLKAQKAVFAGDYHQLPPTVKSQAAADGGLYNTLMEKVTGMYPGAVTLLREQYRMHHKIMHYSNHYFYEGQLMAHNSVAEHTLLPGDQPLCFIDTAGCGFEEQTEGTSLSNPEEAGLLWKHLAMLMEEVTAGGLSFTAGFPSVAVISPYKRQVAHLKAALEDVHSLQPYIPYITVNTIDSFQGQERDIVYISMVRSNSEAAIGFLSDIRRMNVAMTRARKKLVIIGDSATLSRSAFYSGLIAYAETTDAYQSAWELMDI